MRKLLLVLFFACSPLYAQEMPPLVIRDLSAGIVNNVDATLIPDSAVSDSRNMYFDEEYPASKRKGMTKLNSTAVGGGLPVLSQFEYKLSNGTRYHIVHSSTSIYYRLSGSAFTQLVSDASPTYPANYCVFMDTLTWVDGVSNMRSWDTSAVFTQDSTYQPRFIIVWQNRIWIAGDANERSKVRCSEFLDPRDYTVPATPASTDPAVFDINSQDGQKVMGFALSPSGGLLVFKEKSVWEIKGFDRDDFTVSLVLNDIGCIDSRSVAYKDGSVTWLSDRGFIAYNGQSYSKISDNIKNTVESIQQLTTGGGSYVKDGQTSWETNTEDLFCAFDYIPGQMNTYYKKETDYALTAGGLRQVVSDGYNSYAFYIDTSGYDLVCDKYVYNTGVVTNYEVVNRDVEIINFSVCISSNSTKLFVAYTECASDVAYTVKLTSAATSDLATWAMKEIASVSVNSSGYAQATKGFLGLESDTKNNPVLIYNKPADASGSSFSLYLSSYSAESTAWLGATLDSTSTWTCGYSVIDCSDTVHVAAFQDTDNKLFHISIADESSIDYQTAVSTNYTSGQPMDIGVDSLRNPYITVSSDGLFLYSSSGGVWTKTTINASEADIHFIICRGETTVDIYYYIPSDGIYYKRRSIKESSYNTANEIIDGSVFDFMAYSVNAADTLVEYYTDSTYKMCASSSTYTSEIYDTEQTGTYYFREMLVEQSAEDYTVTHYLRSDDSEANISTNTWTEVTINSVPTITAKQYIQYKCVMSTNCVSDNISSVDSVVVQFNSTLGGVYVSSMYYDDRIWNAVSISSSAYLDRQLVCDSNNAWSDMWSVIGCSSLYNYNGTPYWGSNAGYVYTMDTGESDDGNAIPSYITTKAYDLGTLVQQKNLYAIYAQADDSGNWNLNLEYYLDRSGTAEETFNIDLDETANLINYKVPFIKQLPFYTLQYKLSNNGADEPWDFLGLFTYTTPAPLR